MPDSFKRLFPFGIWTSSDSSQRWTLDFNENGCKWTEKNSINQKLTRIVLLQRNGAAWKIQRPNDEEVLRFLGASDDVCAEILARNPNPSFMVLNVGDLTFQATWNGLKWTSSNGHLDRLEQPGTTPGTIKQYDFVRQGDDHEYFEVSEGQLTFDEEGKEGTAYHSRHLHHPTGASGVTLGRGYDMKEKSESLITQDLFAAGLELSVAQSFAAGAGLTGQGADDFVSAERDRLGNITPGQQKRLFKTVYDRLKADVVRISNSQAVVDAYGRVNFDTLDSRICTVLVDLRYRGDYTATSRRVVQKPAADNDFNAFKNVISNRNNWQNVPDRRFQARVDYLGASLNSLLFETHATLSPLRIVLNQASASVKHVQEWLCFHGIGVEIDGVFGPATEKAVKIFQRQNAMDETGAVDEYTLSKLTKPLQRATQPIVSASTSIGGLTIAYAEQHLQEHPIEIGGQNRGPWVRLYLNGHEGDQWAWCAGFACFCLRAAVNTSGQAAPIAYSVRCNELAESARNLGRFVSESNLAARQLLKPGCLFLKRESHTNWTHTGIVIEFGPNYFVTIEGNANDENGGPNRDYEVCRRIRGYSNFDFIRID